MRISTKAALLSLPCGLTSTFVRGLVHPIEIHEQHFYDSVTKDPFFIKGVDYQPGGSSEVTDHRDPLSDPKICARDIFLFQKLGINTIRVYSVSPELDHDVCMTMMAAAGIYLILDVNSPMSNQHLNRYEPWTSYNHNYLQHVFRVIEAFGHYNNTLGFFAGNEIINDGNSARKSPVYVRAVVNDMKNYIKTNLPRAIPVGYSAADDLRYRIPLSKYLECFDKTQPESNIDFYGVNSYQWCGQQTMQSSGYDQLVDAYAEYTKPVFFSEFGCNKVTPRSFGEVEALYSKSMINTFSGGLVYEFTQEPNQYGLVEIKSDGSAHMLSDFKALQSRYAAIESSEYKTIRNNAVSLMASAPFPNCENDYENLEVTATIPQNLAQDFIRKGVKQNAGKFVKLNQESLKSTFEIYDENGSKLTEECKIAILNSFDTTEVDESQEILPKEPEDTDPPKGRERNSAPRSSLDIPFIALWILSYLFLAVYCQTTVFNL